METRSSLLRRVKDRHDEAAWREFDALYRPLLRRFVRDCRLDGIDADDIVQECFAGLVKHIASFEYDPARARFKHYLRTIALNAVRKRLRAQKPRGGGADAIDAAPDRRPTPEEAFENRWLTDHLKHCMKQVRTQVAERTFDAFRLTVVEQQPVEAVCRQLGMRPGTVYQARHAMLKRIRQEMQLLLGEESA